MKEKSKEEKEAEGKELVNSGVTEKSQDQVIEELRLELEKEKNKNQSLPSSGLEELTAAIKAGYSGAGNNAGNNDQISFDHSYINEDSINPEDVLDEKDIVTFVAHKVMYVISDDRRNGKNVRAPLGLIKFKHDSTKTVKNGKETDQFNISTYTCQSKKELEWLRDHSLFGVMFFDKISSAITADAQKATRLAKHVIALKTVGQHQLISMAKSRDIPLGEDLNYLRSMIAQSIVEEEELRIKNKTRETLVEQDLEAKMIGKQVMG